MLNLDLERGYQLKNYPLIAGVDEVGRGPLAGPVVAAAVVVLDTSLTVDEWGITDSKKLTAKKRFLLDQKIRENFQWSIGVASVEEIDEHNVLNASLMAAKRAVDGLSSSPSIILFDGNQKIPGLSCEQEVVIGGDAKIFSIAAASIIAKVYRDELMEKLHEEFPFYGFDKHKGYGTKAHFENIQKLGPCSCHRKTFYPINKYYA